MFPPTLNCLLPSSAIQFTAPQIRLNHLSPAGCLYPRCAAGERVRSPRCCGVGAGGSPHPSSFPTQPSTPSPAEQPHGIKSAFSGSSDFRFHSPPPQHLTQTLSCSPDCRPTGGILLSVWGLDAHQRSYCPDCFYCPDCIPQTTLLGGK